MNVAKRIFTFGYYSGSTLVYNSISSVAVLPAPTVTVIAISTSLITVTVL